MVTLHASEGEFYSLACAFIWAIAVLLFRKSGEQVSPMVLNLFKNTVGLVLFMVTLLVLDIPFIPKDQPANAWIQLLISGVLGVAVADSLFFASLNRLGATNSAIIDCLYSPFVVMAAFLYLGEDIRLSVLGAMSLMAGAILLGTWEPRQPRSPQQRQDIITGIALGVGAMLFTALGIVLAKPVLSNANPWWVTAVRLWGGMVLMGAVGFSANHRAEVKQCFTPGRSWWFTVPAALTGSYVALIMWIVGMKLTLASTASVLNQMSTIFVLILAAIFLKERITVRKTAAILMAFAGALLVTV